MIDKNLIFEKSNDTLNYIGFNLKNNADEIKKNIPDSLLKKEEINLPSLSENEIVRHYINLSNKNFGVDKGFYPLGSCTMKYNPKINEKISNFDSFLLCHPYSDNKRIQGNLNILYYCKKFLLEIVGMDDLTLSPCAGAHGELTGLYVIRKYFKNKNDKRSIVLIPDSAHGTNPASATMAGFKSITVKSDPDGFVDLDDFKNKINNDVAAFMITNPNTLGLFEKNIDKIVKLCKEHDIQLYYDGANLNAFLGICKPGDLGFDVVHINLHKTFATPHGGGGPGAGPLAVKKHLSDFLPGEDIILENNNFKIIKRNKKSIGKVRAFYANFSVVLKAYIYIYILGKDGLSKTGLISLLNANYLSNLLKKHFEFATRYNTMHEFVITLTDICKNNNITVMDFAKRILDYGYHAPTVSFPLIIHDCLMIEPTETESKTTLDNFAATLISILAEAENNAELLKNAPINTPISRADEVKAAREPVLKYEKEKN